VPEIAALVARALRSNDPAAIAPETAALRARYRDLHFIA